MNSSIRFKLFLMMVLEFFIWGAWLPLIFGYLPSLGFNDTWQQPLILNAFPVAAIIGMFFSNQFADRHFAAEKFLAFVQGVDLFSDLEIYILNRFTMQSRAVHDDVSNRSNTQRKFPANALQSRPRAGGMARPHAGSRTTIRSLIWPG